MSLIDNDYQTALLFKQFVGVAAARLDDEFSVEKFRSVPNIFSNDVMIEDIPSSAPYKISGSSGLDASSNWLDSSCNYATNSIEESTYAGPGTDNGKTFAEMFPDTHLKFYKRLSLVPCEQNSNGRVWGSFTDYNGTPMYANKQSVLKHAIPFKYDDINATYSPIVRYNRIQSGNGAGTSTPNFQDTAINSFPLYWIMDAGTGFLQFYQTQTNLEAAGVKDIKISSIQDKDWAPEISLFVYNGKKGITNLDVSGQVQVGDISGVSKITEEIERMVVLDGSAVVTQIDLCGNDTLRAQYEYIRKNLFIGYPTQPILTDYQVDHDFDPSENGIYYELDVSGNSYISGNVDISSNLGVTGTLSVDGNIQGDSNANIAGNLFVDGIIESIDGTRFVDYRKYNSDISGSIMGSGNSQWYCVAKIDPGPAGEFANAVFILDDDTSGLRQSIIFRAGSSYSRGNFVDVLTNHFYSGPKITGIRIDVSGNDLYQGANLYIQRGYTTNATRLFIRVYQNKRKGGDGTNVGWWQLTSTPISNLNATVVQLNLDFNPSGNVGGSKATTLDTLIDAQLKVNEKTTLTDLSATNISTTSNVIVDGDLTVNGYTTIQNGQFIDISGKELDIKDTNILVKSDSPESYLPQTVPGTEYFEIAFINQNSIAPGTNNTVDCVTAYFTFTNNLGSGTSPTDSKQSIHFIAGVYYDQSEPRSFIKVLSNNFNQSNTHVGHIVIAEDTVDKTAYLLLGFKVTTANPMENCVVRMYKNGRGNQDLVSSRYDGGGWIMGNQQAGKTTTGLFDFNNMSVFPASPFAINSLTTNIPIDSTACPNAYSNLYENFLKPVDISSNLRVAETLVVDGKTTLSDHTNAQDISCVRLHIDPNSSANEGLVIENSGSGGGPQITLQCESTSFLGNKRHYKIYADDTAETLHIDLKGAANGKHVLYVEGAQGSTATQLIVSNDSAGGAIIKAEDKSYAPSTSIYLSSNGGRGKLELSNATTNEGIWIGATGTTLPEHRMYIGGSGIMNVGLGISLKSLTELAGANPTFATGEVRINAQGGGSPVAYEDIDFAVNTMTTQNALLVDAANNTVNIKVPFSVDADVVIDGNLQVDEDLTFGQGATIVNTNANTLTITEATTAINGNLTVSGTSTLNDLTFDDLGNNGDIVNLPVKTYINNRGVAGNYKTLTAGGHQEFTFDTQNVNPDDWISIAYVGPPNITNYSKKCRATAKFEFHNTASGCHQTICAYVNFKFGKGLVIDIIKNVRYGDGSRRQIKAFRIAYESTFDGGIFQMQIGDDDATADQYEIDLKISENWDDYGWWCDLSGSPTADNNPVGYVDSSTLDTPYTTNIGVAYSAFWPDATGVQVLDREQGGQGNSSGKGKSTLMYTSDMVLNKVYMNNDLDMSGNQILNATLQPTLPIAALSTYTNSTLDYGKLAIADDCGSTHSSTQTYLREAIVWRPQLGSNNNVRMFVNELIVPLYNRQPAGTSSRGGFGSTYSTADNNYTKYSPTFSSYIIKTAYIGAFPTSNYSNNTSMPISSKARFIRRAWITGLYLSTPWIDSGSFSSSSGTSGLFGFGNGDYLDIQIGPQAGGFGYKTVYRIGNPADNSENLAYFPSATWNNSSNNVGFKLKLSAADWIYMPAGSNMQMAIKLRAVVYDKFYVRNNYVGTDYCYGQIEGYFTYTSDPRLN